MDLRRPDQPEPQTAEAIAALVGGVVEHADGGRYRRVNSVAAAGPDEVAFFRSGADAQGRQPRAQEREAALASSAGLLLVDAEFPALDRPLIRVADPGLAAAIFQRQQCGRGWEVAPGIHPAAIVDESAHVDPSASVAAGVQIGADCRVAAGAVLHPGVVLYPRVEIGADSIIHAHTVLGSPGFGYVWNGQAHVPMPQLGGVRIGRGVEIGANCTIDAGTFTPTEIGDGCILDNLVQIGHNCRLGRAVVLCAQVGLSGSTILEDGVVMGGQSASGGHVTVGAGTQVAGRGGITADVPAGRVVGGVPAVDLAMHQRMQAVLRRLARGKKA